MDSVGYVREQLIVLLNAINPIRASLLWVRLARLATLDTLKYPITNVDMLTQLDALVSEGAAKRMSPPDAVTYTFMFSREMNQLYLLSEIGERYQRLILDMRTFETDISTSRIKRAGQ